MTAVKAKIDKMQKQLRNLHKQQEKQGTEFKPQLVEKV